MHPTKPGQLLLILSRAKATSVGKDLVIQVGFYISKGEVREKGSWAKGAPSLLLAFCSGMIPGRACETIRGAWNQIRVSCVKGK